MRVAIFLMCLFYLLPGGYNYVFTGVHQKSYSQKLHFKKIHRAKFTKQNQHGPVVNETPAAADDAFFIEDAEDDDTNNASARKYKLLSRSFYANWHMAGLADLDNCYKAPQSNHRLLANKYITQRALRI